MRLVIQAFRSFFLLPLLLLLLLMAVCIKFDNKNRCVNEKFTSKGDINHFSISMFC